MLRPTVRVRAQRFIAVASLFSGMALTLLSGATWSAPFTRSITGYAHVSDTFTGGTGFDDDTDVSPINGSLLSGTASFGAGTATYSLDAAAGAGAISGYSAPLSFVNDWLIRHRESQADAYMQLSDRFTLNGVPSGSGFIFRVNWTGELLPNTDFETQYAQVFGTTTVTARATLDLVVDFIDPNTGTFEGIPQHQQVSHASNQGVGEFESSLEHNFFVGARHDIGFILTIGGVGSRGGGFSFLGTAGVGSNSANGILAAFPDAADQPDPSVFDINDLLDHSFFEIVVELPPGASISGGSGYIRQVTAPQQVPEPASL
jgi:hypothetical protein